jgi:hypothetical protein
MHVINATNEFGRVIYQHTTDLELAQRIYASWLSAVDMKDVGFKSVPIVPIKTPQYKVGDKVYVGPDRYDESRAVGHAIVTKIMPGADGFDDFIEVQFPPDLVTLDRVRPAQR